MSCKTTDVRGREMNLKEALEGKYKTPFSLKDFEKYCKSRYSSHHLQFLKNIGLYKVISDEEWKQLAVEIYESFIINGARSEINISFECRKSLKDHFENAGGDDTDKVTELSTQALLPSEHEDSSSHAEISIDSQSALSLESKSDSGGAFKKMTLRKNKRPGSKTSKFSVNNRTVFDNAYSEIFRIVENNLFRPFVQEELAKRELILARFNALWFLPSREFAFSDGHTERQRNKLSFKTFFSFPDPVIAAESQCQSLVSIIAILFFVALDLLLHFAFELDVPWIYIPIVYGFLARTLCGPRLSPQSFFVLFLVAPYLSKKFPGIFKLTFQPGPPKRFAQFCGFTMTSFAFSFRIVDYVINEERQQDLTSVHPFFLASIITWVVAVVVMAFNAFLDICLGCMCYGFLVRLGLFEEVCAVDTDPNTLHLNELRKKESDAV